MRMLARPRPGRSLAVLLLLLLSDGCSGKSSGKKRRKPGKPSAAAAAAETTTCAHCLAIQETIGRAIAQNISGIRRRAVHATLPLPCMHRNYGGNGSCSSVACLLLQTCTRLHLHGTKL